ncbi:Dihydrodipicolinate synthase [Coemansia sp. RSA 2599]|nr:Dihydrodipicolinate synthase [Coemansia sp. RSA 2598]KAJ1824144.1 Dihydrodipicolinate synthase [Coemansia sp. RSA 2599]
MSALLLGFNGKVYDVSSAANFYGPGGAYSMLAGRDSTRALAKSSLNAADIPKPEDNPAKTEDFTESELELLKGWEHRLEKKYKVCGKLICGAIGK